MVERAYKAVVLDLFDTLVKWNPERLPRIDYQGRSVRSTVPWLLPKLHSAINGSFDLNGYLDALHQVMAEITQQRERDSVEVTCHERFARVLGRCNLPASVDLNALAEDLTRLHMAGIRAVTYAPPENVAVVRKLSGHYRLGLLSNFDDSQTGREIVADTGLAALFEAVVISADVGVRKPHPRIFRRMLEMLNLQRSEVLFVGDTPREDIRGAQQAGIAVAWLRHGESSLPDDLRPPDFTLLHLTELPVLLGLE